MALALTIFCLFDTCSGFSILRLGSPYDQVISITMTSSGLLFSISGVRRAKGPPRLAATLGLIYFAFFSALIVLFSTWH
uniref:hypothetical protein n=1 Tax=Tundrisphaera lichenicola TaxID=2029860 RepID=UPI003EBC73F8